jgi:hypothetical protein
MGTAGAGAGGNGMSDTAEWSLVDRLTAERDRAREELARTQPLVDAVHTWCYSPDDGSGILDDPLINALMEYERATIAANTKADQ